jgi:hypothetical protein
MKLPKNNIENKPTINCKQCNKEFAVWSYLINIRKFCSRGCETQWQKNQPGFNKGKRASFDTRRKISLSLIGSKRHTKPHTKETREKLSEISRKQWIDPNYRKKMESILTINHRKASKVMKKKWQDKEFKERVLSKVLSKLIHRPTGLEKVMLEIIRKYRLPYKYTGNGDFWIGGKNPDFININGEKKLIEVGNEFHHRGDYIEKRREHFAQYGWESFIFIQDKLDEEEILKTISN